MHPQRSTSRPEIKELRALRRALGANIQRMRMARQMTLHECAKKARIYPLTLDYYEMGRRQLDLDMLAILAAVFGVKLAGLLVFPAEEN